MTYLAENLASKGYVVAAIGHTDSTFDNVGDFSSTLNQSGQRPAFYD